MEKFVKNLSKPCPKCGCRKLAIVGFPNGMIYGACQRRGCDYEVHEGKDWCPEIETCIDIISKDEFERRCVGNFDFCFRGDLARKQPRQWVMREKKLKKKL